MRFVQDTMGWTELDDMGHVIGHLSHYQHYLYEQAQQAHFAHDWFLHFAFWVQKSTEIDWEFIRQSAAGVFLP